MCECTISNDNRYHKYTTVKAVHGFTINLYGQLTHAKNSRTAVIANNFCGFLHGREWLQERNQCRIV